MDKKVKIGIIGVGNMGSSHINFIKALNNCEVSAICDLKQSVLDRYKDSPFAKFQNSADFFEHADMDAVIISTPHDSHVPFALEAFRRGKHMIVEKPVGVQKRDAEILNDAIAKHPDIKCAAMFCQRTIPAHIKLKKLIDSGELGRIQRINWIVTTWFRSQTYYNSGDWRASWRGEGGGVLLNQCPHHLDLWQWFFGMPKNMRANLYFGKYHNIEVEDDVTAFMEYENGATGVLITSTGEAPGTNRLEIVADHGRVVMDEGVITYQRNEEGTQEFTKSTKLVFGTPQIWDIKIPAQAYNQNMHRDIIENFVNSILNGDKLIACAKEGINSLELGNAMLLSQLEGRTVEFPIDSKVYADHLAKLVETSTYKKPVATASADQDFSKSFAH